MSTERLRVGLFLWLAWFAAASAAEVRPPPTRQPGQLVVAVYEDFAPFARGERGIDVEIGKALAARLGLVAEVREYPDADDVDGDLRNIVWRGHPLWRGRLADVMMHVPVDPDLARKNDQVTIFGAYYRERLAVARSRSRIPSLPTLEPFTREKVGVQAATLEDRYLMTQFGGLLRDNVVHYASVADAAAALVKGEVAAVMGIWSVLEAALAGHRDHFEIGVAPTPGIATTGWELGLAVKADNPELVAALDRAMGELRADGTLARIFQAHGVTYTPAAQESAEPSLRRTSAEPEPAPPPAPREPAPAAAAEPPRPPPGPIWEEIVVTATRIARTQRDTPAAVTLLTREAVERSASKTADELLREVPSFGLFRRSSSMAADPSSQGVNLRGIGPSGVSRSLVLVDGVPANDLFGGWVYWRAMPRIGIERVEVVPGGGSALYGNYALGGVTQFFSRPITPRSLAAAAEYGSFDEYRLGVRAADRRGPIGAAVEAEGLKSSGYAVVAPAQRGAVDGTTPSSSAVVNARVEAAATPDLTLTARGGWFWEDWNGGTRYTTAGVKRFDYGAGASWTGGLGTMDLKVSGQTAEFTQSRARIGTGRATEAQAARQSVPADDLGAGLLWTSRPLALAGRHTLALGSDGRRIAGTTREDLMPPTVGPTSVVHRDAGGTQWLYGVFGQDVYDVSSAVAVHAALRYDRWANTDASRTELNGAGTTTTTRFARRSDGQVSPKLALLVRPVEGVTLRAGAYRAFRAPTLNELYRPFQVGAVRTEANENLGPEKLMGGELGLEAAPARGLVVRATGFWNELEGPITNVTVGTNLRRRENLGQARVRGLEAGATLRFARAWLASAAYTLADGTVTEAPGQPQLVGKDLPQDARHRASASLAFDDPRLLSAVVQARYLGAQYEDDLNAARMGEFVVVDVSASRRIGRNVDFVLGVENLFDEEYTVGRAGVETIGQPRFVHAGVRIRTDR